MDADISSLKSINAQFLNLVKKKKTEKESYKNDLLAYRQEQELNNKIFCAFIHNGNHKQKKRYLPPEQGRSEEAP